MNEDEPAVHGDLRIMGGTPVFVGTRVPFQMLLDCWTCPAHRANDLLDVRRSTPGRGMMDGQPHLLRVHHPVTISMIGATLAGRAAIMGVRCDV